LTLLRRVAPALAALSLIAVVGVPAAASPASASTPTITIAGQRVTTPSSLSNPAAVETFLLRVQAAQHSTSAAFLADRDVSPVLRAAVIRTVTRTAPAKVTTVTGRYTIGQTRTVLTRAYGAQRASAMLAAAWSCGWAQRTVSYTPGVITYYWLELHTDLCSNGYIIANTPSSWHNGSASWGWSYSTAWTEDTWFPYNTEWLSGVGANMTYAWLIHNHPWIKFYDYANGYVTEQWVTT
jgi:hypothetical protein